MSSFEPSVRFATGGWPWGLPPDLSPGRFWVYATVALLVLYGFSLVIYRLVLSPLASVPGPKIAAASFWYEIYYDVVLGGKYYRKIDEMHKKYGPIVRINPHEIHFNDPEFIDSVFPGPGRKTNKFHITGKRTGTAESIVATIDHHTHRQRRNALSGFFSAASTRRLEPIIRKNVQKLLGRMHGAGETGQPLPMHYVFRAMTSDLITEYAFGDSFHFLDQEDFSIPYMKSTDVFFILNHTFGHFPWVGSLLAAAPPWAVKTFVPSLTEMWDKQMMWIEKVEAIRQSPNPDAAKNTIFEGILNSKLPAAEKTTPRLAHEAQLVVFAGEGTTAYTLQAALFELLAQPELYARAKAEVEAATAGAARNNNDNDDHHDDDHHDEVPALADVGGLAFLGAVVQETIRLHPGVVSRLPRVSPDAPVVYTDRGGRAYVLPPGTSLNMTAWISHRNAAVFADPDRFVPQRWLDDPRLDRAFIGFARGTRNCIGMNFARQEMAIVLAAILRKYDIYAGKAGPTLELYDTVRERDIALNHEYIIPAPARGSVGLQIRVRN